MTFSIVAFDPDNGDLGVAVQSKFPNVGGLVPYGRADVGAVATQAFGNPQHATTGLELLSRGARADEALAILLRGAVDIGGLQLALVDATGRTAAHTGTEVLGWGGWAGHRIGRHCSAQGNGLADEQVVTDMVRGFESTSGELGPRLITALQAGQAAGGELRGQQSAALLVLRKNGGYQGKDDRRVTISIYDHAAPIDELARCYAIHGLTYFPSDPGQLVPIDVETALELKTILRRQGFYDGVVDGGWGPDAITSMERFMGWENYDNRIRTDALIDREVLTDIRNRR